MITNSISSLRPTIIESTPYIVIYNCTGTIIYNGNNSAFQLESGAMFNLTGKNIVSNRNEIMVNTGTVNISGGYVKAAQYGISLIGKSPN